MQKAPLLFLVLMLLFIACTPQIKKKSIDYVYQPYRQYHPHAEVLYSVDSIHLNDEIDSLQIILSGPYNMGFVWEVDSLQSDIRADTVFFQQKMHDKEVWHDYQRFVFTVDSSIYRNKVYFKLLRPFERDQKPRDSVSITIKYDRSEQKEKDGGQIREEL